MSFFGKLRSTQAQTELPVKKPPCVVHPENAPRTIRGDGYPDDFNKYEFVGTAIETVPSKAADGTLSRRPALVARMMRKYKSSGAVVEEEMTASTRDLLGYKDPETGKLGHPNAKAIRAALTSFYDNKISPDQQESPRVIEEDAKAKVATDDTAEAFARVNHATIPN